jgi:hypothetical protein
MTDHDQLDSQLRSWLASQAPQRAPDGLRDRVDARLDEVHQAAWWQGWLVPSGQQRGRPSMLLAAALVISAIVVALSGLLGFGTAQPSPLPPPASPSASPAAPTVGPTARPTPPGMVLPAGTNVSQTLDPQITFDVPSGWTKVADTRVELLLSPPGAGVIAVPNGGGDFFDNIAIYIDPLAGAADGSSAVDPAVGRDAKALSFWLAARPQLVASKPIPTTIGDLRGYVVDIAVGPGAGGLCGVRCVNLFNMADGIQYGILEHELNRVFIVDRVGGGTLLVSVEDVDGTDVTTLRAAAQPVIESLHVVAP